jgi:predicted ester cyclase
MGRAGNPNSLGWWRSRAPPTLLAMTDQLSRNKHLVESFIQELFTKGDLTAVDRYVAPDVVNHDLPFPGSPPGSEAWRYAATVIRAAAPDWRSEAHELVAEGDLVVERFTARGTHRGELFGVPATGREIVLYGINVFRIVDDQVVERWGCVDQLGLLHRLGVVPG